VTYLLDTHAFLWSAFCPAKLSGPAQTAICDPGNSVAVSTVTFWEISLKYALDKIELEGAEPHDLPAAAQEMGYDLVLLGPSEASTFHKLPRGQHKDPFDRMLARQAIDRRWTLVSSDPVFAAYRTNGLQTLW